MDLSLLNEVKHKTTSFTGGHDFLKDINDEKY